MTSPNFLGPDAERRASSFFDVMNITNNGNKVILQCYNHCNHLQYFRIFDRVSTKRNDQGIDTTFVFWLLSVLVCKDCNRFSFTKDPRKTGSAVGI